MYSFSWCLRWLLICPRLLPAAAVTSSSTWMTLSSSRRRHTSARSRTAAKPSTRPNSWAVTCQTAILLLIRCIKSNHFHWPKSLKRATSAVMLPGKNHSLHTVLRPFCNAAFFYVNVRRICSSGLYHSSTLGPKDTFLQPRCLEFVPHKIMK